MAQKYWFLGALKNLILDSLSRAPEKSEIKIDLKKENGRITVHLTRQGEKLLGNVFSPFATSSAEMYHQKNLGLTLTICKHIVDAHGGETRLDKGTDLILILPK